METDIEFHRILFRVCDNPVFDAVHTAVVNWLMERWSKIERNETTEKLAYQGHVQISNAVGKGRSGCGRESHEQAPFFFVVCMGEAAGTALRLQHKDQTNRLKMS